MGPGLYEVCRSSTREQVAFGCTRNVADSLCDLLKPRGLAQMAVRSGAAAHYETGELEYRTWPTATLADAKSGGQPDPRAPRGGDAAIRLRARLN